MKNELIHIGDKAYKKCKVILLPTDKAEKCIIVNTNGTFWKPLDKTYFTQDYLKSIPAKSYHLYILSDEEIKEGDYFVDLSTETIHNSFPHGTNDPYGLRKIIATTDNSLKKMNKDSYIYSLPKPSNEFLKKFCEMNGKITEVNVEMYKHIIGNQGAMSFPEFETELRIKTCSDNTITIKPVVEKTYTESQVRDILLTYRRDHGNIHPLGLTAFDEWIEDNL